MELMHFDGFALTYNEKSWYRRLEQHLNDSQKSRTVLRLFRGETFNVLNSSLLRNTNFAGAEELHRRLFYFGVKARRYDVLNGGGGELEQFWHGINDTSPEVMKSLFHWIKDALTRPKHQAKIRLYCSVSFRKYFTMERNEHNFISLTATLPDDQRLGVRDYYLFFLHTIGHEGTHRNTPLVSTTVNRQVARNFSKGGRWGNNSYACVIHYFIPRPFQNFAVMPWDNGGTGDVVHSLGLPSIPLKGIFPNQEEVCVKGALLPRFILGVADLEMKRFIPNPHLFSSGSSFEDICRFGVNIDQCRFMDTIFETGYSGYITTDLQGSFSEQYIRKY
jgi:hypothetical protein